MLRGNVTDSSGASIPRGQFAQRTIEAGINRTAATNEPGPYSVPNLLPGSYEVSASAEGFSSQSHSGVRIEVGTERLVDFTLSVSQQSVGVDVLGHSDPLQSTT